jgi:hypothetical protein
MTTMTRIHFPLVLALTLLVGSPAAADEPALAKEEKSAGFELLFNGNNLDGWQEVQGEPGTFEVRDGILAGRRKKGSAYWLSTKKQYADFELRLEYKIPPKGNSGVFIRAPHDGRTSQKGMEIQICDEPNKATPDKGSTGSIYQVVPARKFAHRSPGEWNELWILCDGDRVMVTINGHVVNDASMSEFDALKDRPRKGFLGLSAHTDTVEYRNIRLRNIQPDK